MWDERIKVDVQNCFPDPNQFFSCSKELVFNCLSYVTPLELSFKIEVFYALSVLSLNQLAPESFVGKHHANCTISFFS